MQKKILTFGALLGIGILGRLLPHPPNATPLTALTRAAERTLGRAWTFIVPVATMLISDALIGFYNWKILLSVYASFLLIALIARLLRTQSGLVNVLALALFGSLSFFLITNFSVWLFSPWYEKSISGLLYCYLLGIPFLKNMLLGDVLYGALVYGVFALPHILATFRNLLELMVGLAPETQFVSLISTPARPR